MKRFLSILTISLICMFFVGCGNQKIEQLQCSKTETDEEGYQTDSSMLVSSKNGKVVKVETTVLSEMDSEMLDFSLSFGNSFADSLKDIKGIEATYEKINENKLQYYMMIDLEHLDLEKLKSTLGDSLDDDSFYTNTEITLEEFKEKNLSGFTCK